MRRSESKWQTSFSTITQAGYEMESSLLQICLAFLFLQVQFSEYSMRADSHSKRPPLHTKKQTLHVKKNSCQHSLNMATNLGLRWMRQLSSSITHVNMHGVKEESQLLLGNPEPVERCTR